MKAIASLLLLLPLFSLAQPGSIGPMNQTYNDVTFAPGDLVTLRNASLAKKGMEIIQINTGPPFITGSGNYWPDGAWERGYESLYSETYFVNEESSSAGYWGSHPLYRRTSRFGRGHIHLGAITGNSADLQAQRDAVDYLIDQQRSNGGYVYWRYRPNQYTGNYNDDILNNHTDPYPTAYALRMLAEHVLSGDTYRIAETTAAIRAAADWLCCFSWKIYKDEGDEGQNANNHGLAAWALSGAYKVTLDCKYRDEVRFITRNLINSQTTTPALREGLWETGGQDVGLVDGNGDTIAYAWHDTRNYYHCFILRGLVEAFDITEDDDIYHKADLVSCINRAVNHVINYRFNPGDPMDGGLRSYHTSVGGAILPSGYSYSAGISSEPFLLLEYNMRRHPAYYSTAERTNVKDISNRLALEMNATGSNGNHLDAIAHYIRYTDSRITNAVVQGWHGANFYYDANKITGRVVSGDFDNDGRFDDVAAMYDYGSGNSRIHVWESGSNHFDYQGGTGWWQSPSWYDANKVTQRFVSGDFDRDGWHDDIAAIYDYGNFKTKIHVWLSDGNQFQYQGGNGWWNITGYDANQVTGRVVSGDFDRDGRHDDIGAFYDYGNNETRLHIWESDGGQFIYQGAAGRWAETGYDANQITGRVVSGDFDRDGRHDDIAAFYAYGSNHTRIHGWESDGTQMIYQYSTGYWDMDGYNANQVTGRVVSGDFDCDGRWDDIAAYYDYGGNQTRIHGWESNGSDMIYQGAAGWWNVPGYDPSAISYRVTSGDFNRNGRNNALTAFYDYNYISAGHTRMHVWLSDCRDKMQYQGAEGWWHDCYPYKTEDPQSRACENLLEDPKSRTELAQGGYDQPFKIYPNPNTGQFTIAYDRNLLIKDVLVYDVNGRVIKRQVLQSASKLEVELSEVPAGLYMVQVIHAEGSFTERVLVE